MNLVRRFQFMRDLPGVAALLAPLRTRMLLRTLWGILILSVLLAGTRALLGGSLWAEGLGVVTAGSGAFWLRRHGEHRTVVAWLASLSGLGLLWGGHNGAGPEILPVAAILPALGALVEGPYLGLGLLLGVCALLTHLGQTPELTFTHGLSLVICAVTAYTMLGVVLGWYWGLRNALAATLESHSSLCDTLDRRDAMAKVIFGDVVEAQQQLAQQLASSDRPDFAALQTHVEAVISQTQQFKVLRLSLAKPSDTVRDFSAPVLRALLLLFLTLALPAAVYQLVLWHEPWWPGPLMVAVCVVGLWSMRRSERAPRWASWAWVGVATLTLSYDMVRDRGLLLTPTMLGWGSCVFEAGLLLGRRAAVVLAVLAIAATLDAGWAIPANAVVWPEVTAHLFAQGMVVLALLQAVDGQKRVLSDLEAKRRTLATAVDQHRRFLGTLFHDIANPLAALNLLCYAGTDGDDAPGDTLRARHLVSRMGLLLEDSRSWLLDEPAAPSSGPEVLDLSVLVEDLQEVFRERIARKNMTLVARVEQGTRVQCRVSALRESVVANLLSNAIKFSPAGSTVTLRAWREATRVHLELADRGPGLPETLREALKSGIDLPSLPGTEGEIGQGLGLALAIEHLRRMGGELALQDREGGGLAARVTLEAA